MDTVNKWEEIKRNIDQLESYRRSSVTIELGYYENLIKRGICFVVTENNEELVFRPSRFIGYRNNNMFNHQSNTKKDGKVTNPAISQIIGHNPEENEYLDEEYKKFCIKLGIKPRGTGQFGVTRKYWVK